MHRQFCAFMTLYLKQRKYVFLSLWHIHSHATGLHLWICKHILILDRNQELSQSSYVKKVIPDRLLKDDTT